MQSEKCYLLLGSNIGDKRSNILNALDKIKPVSLVPLQVSRFYITEPWGFNSADLFYNLAVKIETTLLPHELLSFVLEIENQMGRKRGETKDYLSREIDIDIIFYGDKIINEEQLVVPHPRVHLRKFALIPLCELNSKLIHPILGKTLPQLLTELNDPLEVKIVDFNV